MTTSISLSKSQAAMLFQFFDIDSSGYLTPAKLRHSMGRFGIHLNDNEMSEMVKMYDPSATGQIQQGAFYNILKQLNFQVIGTDDMETLKLEALSEDEHESNSFKEELKEGERELIELSAVPFALRQVLKSLDPLDLGAIPLDIIKRAVDAVCHKSTKELSVSATRKRGLGTMIGKVNHIALIVSDIGQSARFYSEVVGFQQVPRPNFDEHGAWFTMGNLELHLIKGVPVVHSGDDLIVGHISIETEYIEKVPAALQKLGIPFRQNVSVPSGADTGELGTNLSNKSEKVVQQYFIRDPDGYYLEICNCKALEEYIQCDSQDRLVLTAEEKSLAHHVLSRWSQEAQGRVLEREEVLEKACDGSVEEIAKALGCESADYVDEKLLDNFLARTTVYGDICQGEDAGSLENILKLAGNCAKKGNQIMSLKAASQKRQTFQPPPFYEQGSKLVKPPTFTMPV